MKNEEAVENIKDVLQSDYHYDETLGYQLTSDDFEWLNMSIFALEKQIPKKPIQEKYFYGSSSKCPACGYYLGYDFEHVCFCQFCGQALDWSE